MEINEYKNNKISQLTNVYNTKLNNEKKNYERDVLQIRRNFLLPPFQKTIRLRKLESDYKISVLSIKKASENEIDKIKNIKVNSMPTQGSKKALLIGINYTNTSAELSGCINDVTLVESYLKKEGFSEITFITDKTDIKPTRKNIIEGLEKFLSNSKDNDILYFHYSGHGSYIADVNNDETDKKDETIVSFDLKHITDDELVSIIKTKLVSNRTLISFFDSCHSGTVLDLKYIFTEDINKLSIIENQNYQDLNPNIIMISGCRDNQYSQETSTSTGINGLMTWALCQVLSENNVITWKELYINIRKKLRNIGAIQVPQLSIGSLIDINDKSIF